MEVCDVSWKKQILHINLNMDKLVNVHDVEYILKGHFVLVDVMSTILLNVL